MLMIIPASAMAATNTPTAAIVTAALLTSKKTIVQVKMDAMQYTPFAMTVYVGDEVVWHNNDPFPHTVTAKGSFDSGLIPSQGTWHYTATKPGVYAYVCGLHPDMRGLLIVKAK
jgi:plastocyanin